MATKQVGRRKTPAKSSKRKGPPLLAQNEQLQRELKALRDENRQLKKSLDALMFKDLPVNLHLTPEDGVTEPSLTELIAQLERAGKQ